VVLPPWLDVGVSVELVEFTDVEGVYVGYVGMGVVSMLEVVLPPWLEVGVSVEELGVSVDELGVYVGYVG